MVLFVGSLSLYENLRDMTNKSKFSLSERCCEMEVNARVALMDCLNSGYLCLERERSLSALLALLR